MGTLRWRPGRIRDDRVPGITGITSLHNGSWKVEEAGRPRSSLTPAMIRVEGLVPAY